MNWQIKHGDIITIVDKDGTQTTGKAVMFNSNIDAWIINIGGKHGTPKIADDSNIIHVKTT